MELRKIDKRMFDMTGNDDLFILVNGDIGFVCPWCLRPVYVPTHFSISLFNGLSEHVRYSYTVECDKCHATFNAKDYYDPNILEAIMLLNSKGYGTLYSCEGHVLSSPTDEKPSIGCPYIVFKQNCAELKSCPKGWTLFKVYLSRVSHPVQKIEYSGIGTRNEHWKEEALTALYEWVDSLPNIINNGGE
jgi:hypothetical protein